MYNYVTKQKHTKEGILNEELALKKLLIYMKSVYKIQKIYGLHLKSVILYGSYTQGDFTKDSDVDSMILVDLSDEEIEKYSDELAEIGFDYNVAYGIWMMPVVRNQEHFRHWGRAYSFYKNVQKEGIKLYEADSNGYR